MAVGAIALALALILFAAWQDRHMVLEASWALVVWAAAIALVGLASVPSLNGPQLGLDMPLLLAAAFLFGPGVSGALAFVGYVDAREFRGQISLLRALYNRAQTALSVMLAAAIFSAIASEGSEWPGVLVAAISAVAADAAVNYALVSIAKGLHEGTALWRIIADLRLGNPRTFLVTYACYGLLSLVLSEIYRHVGVWGLAAFAMPVVLARQAFEQNRELEAADARIRLQSEALRDASSRVTDERRDERLVVAAGLHDEVLPPLFKVHLMGQVLRQDLASGRLLALEDDIPELLRAVDSANTAIRGLISGLRRSPLGTAGFKGTLALLVQHLQTLSAAKFSVSVEEIEGPPLTQLLAYQVIREALNNAVRHSGATSISVWTGVQDGAVRLVVEDDGQGFAPGRVDGTAHFGLSMMRERVELIGGILHIESAPGRGTKVVARLPVELNELE